MITFRHARSALSRRNLTLAKSKKLQLGGSVAYVRVESTGPVIVQRRANWSGTGQRNGIEIRTRSGGGT